MSNEEIGLQTLKLVPTRKPTVPHIMQRKEQTSSQLEEIKKMGGRKESEKSLEQLIHQIRAQQNNSSRGLERKISFDTSFDAS